MKRWRLAVGLVMGLVLVALITAYLTGFISVGDPFVGTWRPAGGGKGALVVRKTPEGYGWTYFVGDAGGGFIGEWTAERHRNVLTSVRRGLHPSDPILATDRLVFHPWNRHLVMDYSDVDDWGGLNMEFVKVGDSTSPTA